MNKASLRSTRDARTTLALVTGLLLTVSILANDIFTFDVTGRLVQANYGAAGAIRYNYDLLGHLTNLTITASGPDLDSDLDQLPDAWEWVYFNGLSQPADTDPNQNGRTNLQDYQQRSDPATDDNDGDGLLNAHELIVGSDPFDPTSHLQLDSVAGQPHTLTWTGVAGRLYQILRSTDLAGAFVPMTDFMHSQTPVNYWTDPNPPSGGAFYRLQLRLE